MVWSGHLPTHVALAHPAPVGAALAARIDALVDAGSQPTIEFGDLAAAGFVADSLPPLGLLALIDLPTGSDATPVGVVMGVSRTRLSSRTLINTLTCGWLRRISARSTTPLSTALPAS